MNLGNAPSDRESSVVSFLPSFFRQSPNEDALFKTIDGSITTLIELSNLLPRTETVLSRVKIDDLLFVCLMTLHLFRERTRLFTGGGSLLLAFGGSIRLSSSSSNFVPFYAMRDYIV